MGTWARLLCYGTTAFVLSPNHSTTTAACTHDHHIRGGMHGQVLCEPCTEVAAKVYSANVSTNPNAAPPPTITGPIAIEDENAIEALEDAAPPPTLDSYFPSVAPPPMTEAKATAFTALQFTSEGATGSFSHSELHDAPDYDELQDTPDLPSRTDASKLRSLRAPKATKQMLWHGHWPHRHHLVCALCAKPVASFVRLVLRRLSRDCDCSIFRTGTTSTLPYGSLISFSCCRVPPQIRSPEKSVYNIIACPCAGNYQSHRG